LVQTKSTSANIVKEKVALKTQIDNLRKELTEKKELLTALQNLTMDNSQKILDLSLGNIDYNGEYDESNTNLQEEINGLDSSQFSNLNDIHVIDDNDSNEIVGTDLKQLIESELNTSM